ncbi:MAG: amino acid ABC transporter substrate-binding protein [Lentisphaerae bacterium]|nr:amino acid ABC transporter substrate-binding protein [Lentisphaerota bacterium]
MIKRTLLALFGTLFMLCGCVNPDDVLSNPVLLGEQTLIQSDVVIGAALPLTGKYSVQGMEMLRGIETAVDVLNARRGIAGRRVRLETADTNGTPDGAEKAMSSLAAKKASIVVGGYSTTETDGLIKNIANLRIPLVIPCATADGFSGVHPFVFRTSYTDTQQAEGLAAYLWYWRQIKRVGVLIDMRPSAEYERNVARSVAQSFSDLGGEVVRTAEYTDVDSCVAAMREVMGFGPQAIMVPAIGEEAAMMVRALRKLNYKGVICGADGWDGIDFFTALGKNYDPGECFYVTYFSNEYQDDEFKSFVADFQRKFYHIPGSRSTAARDALIMAASCIGNAETIQDFKRNWLALQNFFGASSVFNPKRSGDVDRLLFLNSVSPGGVRFDYPYPRLIRSFMHSKLETYKFD